MTQLLTPSLILKKNLTVYRARELPIPGNILVAVGQEVSPTTIVARAEMPGDLAVLRVAEELGVLPTELPALLKVKHGDVVSRDQVLALHRAFFGLISAEVRAPQAGVIENILESLGHLTLRGPPVLIEKNAYLMGRVSEVKDKQRVVIESYGTVVQGIFGVGGERQGSIKMLAKTSPKALLPEDLPGNTGGAILVGGTNPSPDTLKAAAQAGIVGLVVGGIDDSALRSFLGYDLGVAITGDENVPFTLIVTEGFGSLPISEKTLSLLSEFEGCMASINGATQVRAGALRPEIVISQDRPLTELKATAELELCQGAKVRIIRIPYFGAIGTISKLPSELVELETGAQARVLWAKLESGQEVCVPRANVEVIG